MRCLVDPKNITIFGNYDSQDAQNFMVVFEKCDPLKSTIPCKTEAEINEWLLMKYFMIFSNEKKFISHKFDEDKIQKLA